MGSKDSSTTSLGGVIVGKSPYSLPSGSLHLASQNVMLREADTLESRRGIQRVLKTLQFDKLIAYAGAVFGHSGTALECFAADFSTTTSAGTASNCATRKVQSAAAGGRLFLTTGDGLRVLDDAIGVLRPAGGPIASNCVQQAGGVAGFLAIGFQVAYRYTIGRVTASGVQIIGPPSGRAIVANTGGVTMTVPLSCNLPTGLDDTHFVQVWRSAQVATTIEPDDDLRLVYERNITIKEATVTKTFTLEDVVPDALRGEFLYTSPNAGEGIQQANNPPPLAEEIALHKDRLWLGRTTQPFSFSFKLLAIGGAGGLVATDRIIITSQSPALVMVAGTDFTVTTGGSASYNITETSRAIVARLNYWPTNTSVWAEYVSGPDDSLGEIRIYERTVNGSGAFEMYVDQRSGGAAWSMRSAYAPEFLPYLPGAAAALTYSLQRAANVVTATVSSGNITNALRVGDSVVCTNPSGSFLSASAHTVTAVTATTFTYDETAADAGPTAGYVFQMNALNIAKAAQDSFVNRIHYSKPFEYEAFPFGNYADVGASDKGIIAMRVTRETLWVFKEDGLFRITGDDDATFDVERVDATILAVTPECVRAFAESVVAWTTRGIVLISESSFDIISGDVDKLLRDYLDVDATLDTTRLDQAFMVVDDKEGSVRLHLPGSSVNDNADVIGAGECLAYFSSAKTWQRFSYPGLGGAIDSPPKPFAFGIVNPADRRVLYSDAFLSAGEGFIWREWKTTDSKVYSDDIPTHGSTTRIAIWRRALWVAQYGKAPLRDKRFDEVSILFAQRITPTSGAILAPSIFGFGFGNENDEQVDTESYFGLTATAFPQAPHTSGTPNNPVVRIAVPTNFARGQRLWIRIDETIIDVPFALHGFSILAEVLNASIAR